jgi:hypothetical protein
MDNKMMLKFADTSWFSEGLCAVKDFVTNKWHFIDDKGKVSKEFFDSIDKDFSNGLCIVVKNGEKFTIDKSFNKTDKKYVEKSFDYSSEYIEGYKLEAVKDGVAFINKKGRKLNLIAKDAKFVQEGFAPVQLKDDSWTLYNVNSEEFLTNDAQMKNVLKSEPEQFNNIPAIYFKDKNLILGYIDIVKKETKNLINKENMNEILFEEILKKNTKIIENKIEQSTKQIEKENEKREMLKSKTDDMFNNLMEKSFGGK